MAACRDRYWILRVMTRFRFVLAALLIFAFPAHGADRTIYLTFDDGPLNGTSNILDVVETEQVPATMFMVGMHAQASAGNRALVQRAKQLALVTLGNHSYSHANNRYQHFYADTEGVVADMMRANAAQAGGARAAAGARRVQAALDVEERHLAWPRPGGA
jgi:peptidoglycan/xylan/chitin deacetylase (PgdA/CDA1 family)